MVKLILIFVLPFILFACNTDGNRKSNAAAEAKDIHHQITMIEQQLNAYISQKIDENGNRMIQKNLVADTSGISNLELENKFLLAQRTKLSAFHTSFEPYQLTKNENGEEDTFKETEATKNMTDQELLLTHQGLKTELMQIEYATKEILAK